MKGDLFVYEPSKRLVAFESDLGYQARECIIIIGGLTDGLLSLPYFSLLADKGRSRGFSVIQPLLSSSYTGYGTSSLEQDSQELAALIEFLVDREIKSIILLGHSTGCQDILWYLKYRYKYEHNVKRVILQGPLSDRDYFSTSLPNYTELLYWAAAKVRVNKGDELYPQLFCNAPITAYRLYSLLAPLGDDDFFSLDLNASERRDKFGVVPVPVAVAFSAMDEYFSDPSNYDALGKSFKGACEMIDILKVIPNADHAISQPEAQQVFYNEVVLPCLEQIIASCT